MMLHYKFARFVYFVCVSLILAACGSGAEDASQPGVSQKPDITTPIEDVTGVWHGRIVGIKSVRNPNLVYTELSEIGKKIYDNFCDPTLEISTQTAVTMAKGPLGGLVMYSENAIVPIKRDGSEIRFSAYYPGGETGSFIHQNISESKLDLEGESFGGYYKVQIRPREEIDGPEICTQTYHFSASLFTEQKAEAPTNLSAEAISHYRVALKWEDQSKDEIGFKIFRSIQHDNDFSEVGRTMANQTEFVDRDVKPEQSYVYHVKSYNSAGNGVERSENVVVTVPALENKDLPNKPGNVVAENIGVNKVKVTWDDLSDNEDRFEILRSIADPISFSSIGQVRTNKTEYIDETASVDTDYFYQVRAVRKYKTETINGDASTSDKIKTLSIPIDTPGIPSGLSATSLSDHRVAISWSHSGANVDRFIVVRQNLNVVETPKSIAVLGPDARSFIDNWNDAFSTEIGLSPGVDYKYWVRAGYFNSVSGLSSETGVETDLIPESIPSQISGELATPTSSDKMMLSWEPVSDATTTVKNYLIQRSPTGAEGSYSAITNLHSGNAAYLDANSLLANSTYFYRIFAENNQGSADFIPLSGTTKDVAPDTPTDFKMSDLTQSFIDLSWFLPVSPPKGVVANYVIDHSNTADHAGYTNLTTLSGDVGSFRHSGLEKETIHYYRLRATNNHGKSPYIYLGAITTASSPPAQPSGISFTNVTNASMTINWPLASGATAYRVHASIDNGFTPSDVNKLPGSDSLNATSTSLNVTGLSGSTTYYFKVVALNHGNGLVVGSGVSSAQVSQATKLDPPATPVLVLSVPADSSTTLNLSWSSSLRAQSYEILRSTSPVSDSAAAIATVAANQASYAYTDTGLTGGVRYYYKLRAVNETANAVSGEKNAETKVKMTLSVENGLAGVIRKDATKLGILCSANSVNGRSCSTYLNKGTTVTVIATSDTGSTSTFLKWLGACAAQGASCVLTVNANSSTNACATILCGVKFEPPILPIIP